MWKRSMCSGMWSCGMMDGNTRQVLKSKVRRATECRHSSQCSLCELCVVNAASSCALQKTGKICVQ